MRNILFILIFSLLAAKAQAQQVVLVCYSTPTGTVVCTPVSTAHPLPTISN